MLCGIRESVIKRCRCWRRKSLSMVSLTSGDLFKDRRIVLFALPGIHSTCSAKQLPMYEQNLIWFKKCVDDIYCLSVNDSFVMNAWFRYQNIKHVKPIPDGSGLFTAEIGMMVDKDNLSFGSRSQRYALLLNDSRKDIYRRWFW